MAAAAFWIALAAIFVAESWRKKVTEQTRHDTVRQLLEKQVTLDERQVRDLLQPPGRQSAPEQTARNLRALGCVLMIGAAGYGAMMYTIGTALSAVIGITFFIVVLGAALFVSARFAAPLREQ